MKNKMKQNHNKQNYLDENLEPIETIEKIYKPATHKEVIVREFFFHYILMPMKAKKPALIGKYKPRFVHFCNSNNTKSSKEIYTAYELGYKIYEVYLYGEISWNDYKEKLIKIQPDIQITDVWVKSSR